MLIRARVRVQNVHKLFVKGQAIVRRLRPPTIACIVSKPAGFQIPIRSTLRCNLSSCSINEMNHRDVSITTVFDKHIHSYAGRELHDQEEMLIDIENAHNFPLTSSYVYWIDLSLRFSSTNLDMLRHCPCPEHSRGQLLRSQADPEKPPIQVHLPVFRLHVPRLEHSTAPCAVSMAVASSLHASPVGQLRSEQSPPLHPPQQSHLHERGIAM